MDTSGNIRFLGEDEAPRENEMLLTNKEAKTLGSETPKKRKNWMRNKPCICGSGKKFKKCCWSKAAMSNQ